jgi:hypothetical protein
MTPPHDRRGRSDAPDPGEIPNYDLLSFIKSGGFGDVWLARERVTGVRRAVKVLMKSEAERVARDIAGVRRYQCCAHNHPHLLQILTVGETERCFYYVMEAADDAQNHEATHRRSGTAADEPSSEPSYTPTTLRTAIDATGRFEARAALELMQKLVSAVSRLHEQGLAHYDLKPNNILMVEGLPKIADVGLVASRNEPPPRSGTPVYMTPQGEADDVYALGRILYELISGRAATDFPRLLPELLRTPSRELTAALTLVNHACHADPHRRFASVDELGTALVAALRTDGRVRARWRRLSRRARTLITATSLLVTFGVCYAADVVYSRVVPRRRSVHAIPLAPADFKLVAQPTPDASGIQLHPYLRLKSTALPAAGHYVQGLARPLENFVVDYHLLCRRPWGTLQLGLADQERGGCVVRAALCGQPDGIGLRTMLETENDGARQRSEHFLSGHPQPGLQYVLRLARCGEEIVLALWPLARRADQPLVLRIPLPQPGFRVEYLMFDCTSGSALDEMDLLGVQVAEYSAPLTRIDQDLPEVVAANTRAKRVTPAFVPEIATQTEPWEAAENLLAGRWHPYDSGAWMSVGNWSWWSDAMPGATAKTVRCVPYSTEQRRSHPQNEYYSGFQFLRFDGARCTDFDATLRIKLLYATDGVEFQPFACESHSGQVGLALRLQDQSPAAGAWGGGYVASLKLASNPTSEPVVAWQRFSGLVIESDTGGFAVCPTPGDNPHAISVPFARDLALSPDGFQLRVRAVGAHFEIFVNDRPVLAAEDSDADYFRAGRIALFASRLMATFESLEVTPLD